MNMRPDGKCNYTVVVSLEQKKMFKEMRKNGFNPQPYFREKADELIEVYKKIQKFKGGKNEKQ